MILKAISLALILVAAATAKASFEENAHRYLSAQELTDSINLYFPMFDAKCQQVGQPNASLTGVNSPLSGNPIAPSPTQSTVQWLSTCISRSFEVGSVIYNNWDKMKVLVGPEVDAWLTSQNNGNYDQGAHRHYLFEKPWSDWPENIKSALIKNIVTTLLGSDDVIQDFGLTTGDLLRAKLAEWSNKNSNKKAVDILKGLSVNLVLRDEFLSY